MDTKKKLSKRAKTEWKGNFLQTKRKKEKTLKDKKENETEKDINEKAFKTKNLKKMPLKD